ncbi:hypothetical protein NDU88_005443 [Pleurodeles waltl]|uniref:Uncharacterized protein n=1 Tax=Pleurodeles waltl TaxID=8319 RepID=A0AAV7WYA2_PLEWA|nr:hypothetical protein NDU88_005443 [Pleurodeles waltl]
MDRTALIEKLKANYNLLQDKLDDLENRSRHNVCIRGIDGAGHHRSLRPMFKLSLPAFWAQTDQQVLVDHTQRVFSQYQQQRNLPPTVLTRIHYFHIKEKIMQAAR